VVTMAYIYVCVWIFDTRCCAESERGREKVVSLSLEAK
jgi:hypothetical protein